MTYRLTAIISHKQWDEPVTKEFYYTGDDLDSIVEQIETLPFHRQNLKTHKKTAFKSTDGVKHSWLLTLMPELN